MLLFRLNPNTSALLFHPKTLHSCPGRDHGLGRGWAMASPRTVSYGKHRKPAGFRHVYSSQTGRTGQLVDRSAGPEAGEDDPYQDHFLRLHLRRVSGQWLCMMVCSPLILRSRNPGKNRAIASPGQMPEGVSILRRPPCV